MWSPTSKVIWRCMEDWEFKVWQWLNFWLPWWPFQYLSAANLLKSFYSTFTLHKVPHQLRLDYLSLFPVRQGPASLTHTHTFSRIHTHSQNPQSPSRQTNLYPSPHFLSPLCDKKRQPLPLSKPPLHCKFFNLDYLSSLFHETGPSHRSPFLSGTSSLKVFFFFF